MDRRDTVPQQRQGADRANQRDGGLKLMPENFNENPEPKQTPPEQDREKSELKRALVVGESGQNSNLDDENEAHKPEPKITFEKNEGDNSEQALLFEKTGQTSAQRLTPEEVGQRFLHRRQQLAQACAKFGGNSSLFKPLAKSYTRVTLNSYKPVVNVSVGYCPIEKTGSTTWIKMLGSIRRSMRARRVPETGNSTDPRDRDVTFLFVRDPYSRLLSAYADKLFGPNTMFWNMGKYIIKTFRPNPSNRSLACGHDVTFPEFVQYVIHAQETGESRNPHFVPTHDHCSVCDASYDYIGHLETLSEDMPYILEAMQSPVNYTASFDSYTIADNTRWVMGRMNPGIRKCMTMREAFLRLWKKWHVRGIIRKTEPLPVGTTEEEADVISADEFINASMEVLARSGSKAERQVQKTEALREAFAAVSIEDRLRLQKVLLLDFELYGFDPKPETVFPTRADDHDSVKDSGRSSYRYFDVQIQLKDG